MPFSSGHTSERMCGPVGIRRRDGPSTRIFEDIDMQALTDFYRELIDLYAYQVETTQAILKWAELLSRLATREGSSFENSLFFGRGNPDDPNSKYQYARTFKELIRDSEEGARNFRLHRNGVIALAYTLWEVEYRQRIAIECGLTKSQVQSDVFQDLNKYRQAVLHVGGRLDREPKVMRFFAKGDVVSFTENQMHTLFSLLINELNRMGRKYCKQDPNLSLDKPFHRT